MTQFEQQVNLPTGQGPLGNFFCDADRPAWDPDSAELFETRAPWCDDNGQSIVCAFSPDSTDRQVCDNPPQPEPSIFEAGFAGEAAACPAGVTTLPPPFDSYVRSLAKPGYKFTITEAGCQDANGNAQYVARYQVDADPLTNPATEAERLSTEIASTGNTICKSSAPPSFCTFVPGAEGTFACAQFPNDPNGVDTQPLFCIAAGGSTVLGLVLDTGVTCASVTTPVTQLSTDVLAYISSLQAFDPTAWTAKVPSGEIVCQTLTGGNGRFNMRYALVPKSLTGTVGVMDISDTLLAVSTAVNEAATGPCAAAPPALFCSYLPNSLMCAPSPPLVWNQDLSQLLTLC